MLDSLRIGAVITDNKEFHTRCVAEYTANLCANAIGQYILEPWLMRVRKASLDGVNNKEIIIGI